MRAIIKRSMDKKEEFSEFIQELVRRRPKSTLILFGSRARGDATPLSDYDLLAITEGPLNVEKPTFVQLFVIDVRDLEFEVKRFNTLLVDAITEGVVLHDGLKIYEEVRKKVEEEIKARKVKKDWRGWVPEFAADVDSE